MKQRFSLKDAVCLVTGASRGLGKGIAVVLGECGATVYITGRTLKPKGGSVGGSLEETADEIRARGGKCIPVAVDHSDEKQVSALFDQIRQEQNGRLDVLVNNAYSAIHFLEEITGKAYYEIDSCSPGEAWDKVNNVGLRNHYICATLATQIMIEYQKRGMTERPGLIVNVSSMGGSCYLFTPLYGCGKAAMDRMAYDMSVELKHKKVNVSIISLWPGLVRTEEFMEQATTADYGLFADYRDSSLTQSVELSGFAIAALACEDQSTLLARSGSIVVVSDVAVQYDICEIDDTSPTDYRSLNVILRLGRYRLSWLVPDFIRIPMLFFPWILRNGYKWEFH